MKVLTLDALKKEKYGRLEVLEIIGTDRFGHTVVLTICDCGNEKKVVVSDLKKTKSCGCILKEKDKSKRRFGKLVAMSRLHKVESGDYLWRCVCDCGADVVVLGGLLHSNRRGCPTCARKIQASKVTRHGMKAHPLYRTWRGMKNRCHLESDKQYSDYGGRGIYVCDEWRTEAKSFLDWALFHPSYAEGLQLDRIDNDGPYSPENCRWVTSKENCNNRRSSRTVEFNGKIYTLAEAVRLFGKTDYGTTLGRLRRGWSIERALSEGLKRK